MRPAVEEGTSVAGAANMVRRVIAMIGIALVLALALALMWRVYLHRERSRTPPDEPTLVWLNPGPDVVKVAAGSA